MEKKKYPVGAEHYELYEEIGQGVSASVFRAMCIPNKEIVAVKVLDFERSNNDLVNSAFILSCTIYILHFHDLDLSDLILMISSHIQYNESKLWF